MNRPYTASRYDAAPPGSVARKGRKRGPKPGLSMERSEALATKKGIHEFLKRQGNSATFTKGNQVYKVERVSKAAVERLSTVARQDNSRAKVVAQSAVEYAAAAKRKTVMDRDVDRAIAFNNARYG